MKKLCLFAVFALLFATTSYSQVTLVVNAGGRFPSSDLNNAAETGYGIAVAGEFNLPTSPLIIEVTAGLDNFKIKNQTTTDFKLQYVPLLAGAKYMFKTPGSMFTIYVGGRLGLVLISTDVPNTNSESAFGWSPEAGFRYAISPTLSIDVNAFYLSASKNGFTNAWFGASAGVAFGL